MAGVNLFSSQVKKRRPMEAECTDLLQAECVTPTGGFTDLCES